MLPLPPGMCATHPKDAPRATVRPLPQLEEIPTNPMNIVYKKEQPEEPNQQQQQQQDFMMSANNSAYQNSPPQHIERRTFSASPQSSDGYSSSSQDCPLNLSSKRSDSTSGVSSDSNLDAGDFRTRTHSVSPPYGTYSGGEEMAQIPHKLRYKHTQYQVTKIS